jgi:hypothetical protein
MSSEHFATVGATGAVNEGLQPSEMNIVQATNRGCWPLAASVLAGEIITARPEHGD